MALSLDLHDQVAVVTGGSKGVGRAIALGLVREGASVLICARGREAMIDTERLAANGPGMLSWMETDLAGDAASHLVVGRCIEEFGRLDILVNNAALATTPGEFLDLPDVVWVRSWTLKFLGYVRMARAAMQRMAEQRSGVVVNIGGVAALMPGVSFMVGGSTNAAIDHLTRSLADEGSRYGVRVVGVHPGFILTEHLSSFFESFGTEDSDDLSRNLSPLGRVGSPEEVADLVLFLASARAGFINGTSLAIDGGLTAVASARGRLVSGPLCDAP